MEKNQKLGSAKRIGILFVSAFLILSSQKIAKAENIVFLDTTIAGFTLGNSLGTGYNFNSGAAGTPNGVTISFAFNSSCNSLSDVDPGAMLAVSIGENSPPYHGTEYAWNFGLFTDAGYFDGQVHSYNLNFIEAASSTVSNGQTSFPLTYGASYSVSVRGIDAAGGTNIWNNGCAVDPQPTTISITNSVGSFSGSGIPTALPEWMVNQGGQFASSSVYIGATVGTSTLLSTTNFLSFLNVPFLLQTKVPFGYFFEARSAIIDALATTSAQQVPIGTISFKLGRDLATTTVTLFSTSTLAYFLPTSAQNTLRGIMVIVLYAEFLYAIYHRARNVKL